MTAPLFLCRLALKSLWSRRGTALLIILSLTMGVALVIGVEKLRRGAEQGFANTISGTDLVVGARSGSINLLLYSVFRVGNATSNVSWSAYQKIVGHRDVAWTIPLSLGDSHKGFRVIGTTTDYFKHYRYGRRQMLRFETGKAFDDLFDVVIGAAVAEKLNYQLGDSLVLRHGLGDIDGKDHDDKPFKVSGILTATGTPVDHGIHISLQGVEALHVDWQNSGRQTGFKMSVERLRKLPLTPKAVTAVLVGLKSRFSVFGVQRQLNSDTSEPLLAILPGVALQELWDLLGNVEWALSLIAGLVALSAILGMLAMLLAGLNERRRELSILRAVGARPWHIIALITLEAVGLVTLSILMGLLILFAGFAITSEWMAVTYGIRMGNWGFSEWELIYLVTLLALGLLTGLIPSILAYRKSLSDGLMLRL